MPKLLRYAQTHSKLSKAIADLGILYRYNSEYNPNLNGAQRPQPERACMQEQWQRSMPVPRSYHGRKEFESSGSATAHNHSWAAT